MFGPDLKIGSIVHYVMRAEDYLPGAVRSGYQHRPALVLDIVPPKSESAPLNLVVFLAGPEDGAFPPAPPATVGIAPVTLWRAGIVHSADHTPGTWHWPES